jgi:hypothetical protein
MEEKNAPQQQYEGILNYERDWQRIKDLMTFLENDSEKDTLLRQFIMQNTRS